MQKDLVIWLIFHQRSFIYGNKTKIRWHWNIQPQIIRYLEEMINNIEKNLRDINYTFLFYDIFNTSLQKLNSMNLSKLYVNDWVKSWFIESISSLKWMTINNKEKRGFKMRRFSLLGQNCGGLIKLLFIKMKCLISAKNYSFWQRNSYEEEADVFDV